MLKLVTLLLAAAVCLAIERGEDTWETDSLDASQLETSVNEADKTDAHHYRCKLCYHCYWRSSHRCRRFPRLRCCIIGRYCFAFTCRIKSNDADKVAEITSENEKSIEPVNEVFNEAAPAEEFGGKRRCRICTKCVREKRVPGCGMCCDYWKGGSCKYRVCGRQD